jgi:hypothetical protein
MHQPQAQQQNDGCVRHGARADVRVRAPDEQGNKKSIRQDAKDCIHIKLPFLD